MGIEIYPQTLKSGLLKVNIQLNQAVENAQPYIKSIKEFIGTDQLDSIAFGSQKDYMNRGHLMAIKSQIQAIEAVISANQRHINLIDCYLEGETYVSEEALQEQLKNVRKIQWIAQDLKLSEICDVMYELEQYIQAKIEKLYEYEQAQRGLYDSVLAAIATAELYGSALHGATYNSNTGKYLLLPTKNDNKLIIKESAFIDNLQSQFGFDEKTSIIIVNVYNAIKQKNPDANQKEIDRMFSRSISQLFYNKGDAVANQWRAGAGYQYGYGEEEERKYFIDKLGLSQSDYKYLRQMIRLQQFMVSSPKKYSYNAVKTLKTENYDEFKTWKKNMQVVIGKKLSDNEYLDYYKRMYQNMRGKPDFSHMMYTISANLVTKSTKGVDNNFPNFPTDIVTGDFWTTSQGRREFTGWLGDATYTGRNGIVSFGDDDYKSDLDANNIAERMKKGSTIIEAMNNYYEKVSENSSVRCQEFLSNTEYDYVEKKVFGAAGVDSLNELKNKKGWIDSYKFLWNLKEGNGAMKTPK